MTTPPVEKMFYVGKRNPALRAAEFSARWKQHAVLSSTVATVADVVLDMAQCSRVADGNVLPGVSTEYDGVSVLTVTDPQRIFASQKEPKHIELLLPDELQVFTDYVSKSTVIGHEKLVFSRAVERAKNKVILIDIHSRRRDVACEEFASRWTSHAGLVQSLPGFHVRVLRFAQNTIYGQRPAGHEYDAISELWFDSIKDVPVFLTEPARRILDADLSTFVDTDRRLTLLTSVSHAFYRPGRLAQFPHI